MSYSIFIAQNLVIALSLSGIYVLIGVGVTLIFGIMHIANFAHGEFLMLGAFATYYFCAELFHFPYSFALVLSAFSVAIISFLAFRIVFQPLQGKFRATVTAALGLMLLLQSMGYLVFGIQEKSVPSPFPGTIHFAGILLSKERLMVIVAAFVLILGLLIFVRYTKPGRAMRAIEQAPEAAALMGVDVTSISRLGFIIGCALAAIAGSLIAPLFLVEPNMGLIVVVKGFTIVILGGIGSVTGAIVGGLILGFLESFITLYFDATLANIICWSLIIFMIVVKPTGLFGHAT
jgi:branched-chain amino acid transport system permease protein